MYVEIFFFLTHTFMNEQESVRRRNTHEGAELSQEQKEKQVEEAEKKMAAKERAEVVGKEVKNTKQQMQNITANMIQVVKAVQAIRTQLGLTQTGAIPSVAQDEKTLAALRAKLDGLMGEVADLKNALLAEETKVVREENSNWNEDEVFAEAQRRVNDILNKLDLPAQTNHN